MVIPKKLLLASSVALLLSGCATQGSLLKQKDSQIRQLQDKITALDLQNQQLSQKIQSAKEAIPAGVIAVDAQQKEEIADGTVISPNGSGYDHALKLYQAGDVDGAISGFMEYLNSGEASGEQRNLALFWLGEANYTKNDYAQAARYLGQYLKNDPQGDKVNLALPRLISVLKSLGRTDEANILAQQGVSAIQ